MKKLRVELLAVGNVDSEILGNILSTIAFDVRDQKICTYGMIISNVIQKYISHTLLKHVVLKSPVFWPEYQVLADEDVTVAWLMIVPITDSEKKYIEQYGISAFDSLLDKENIDVIDIHRQSAI